MFDSGFSELLLIMIVALVVVGPERLPALMRKVGYWVGRFRRYANTVKAEIERELNADELRSMLSRQEDEIRELRDMLEDTRDQMRSEVDEINEAVNPADATHDMKGASVSRENLSDETKVEDAQIPAKSGKNGTASEHLSQSVDGAMPEDDHVNHEQQAVNKRSTEETRHGGTSE
ncbi:Sec-independent protein translocase protein TatB [Acidihalobacter prosperus]